MIFDGGIVDLITFPPDNSHELTLNPEIEDVFQQVFFLLTLNLTYIFQNH